MTTTQTISTGSGFALVVETARELGMVELRLQAPAEASCLLHWGLRLRGQKEWSQPPSAAWPAGSEPAGGGAVRSPFTRQDGRSEVVLRLGGVPADATLEFVLFFPQANRWDNNGGRNYRIPLAEPTARASASELADTIIEAETTHGSWTLMHRFNLCHDLLDQARDHAEGLAWLYVWLRFSAIRQLTWQRNYNTKPRELAHAQDRLTQKLAECHRSQLAGRPLLRLMLTTVGRGGEGQRIRDEILNIMHRHHIKEVSGHFLEEWHQKLHNNTTPDDVVICQAYIEFLRSNGSRERFYEVLLENGVTRERLEGFERPIRSQPDFVPHLKDALLHDFYHFLGILKAAHSGTDFETALAAARGRVDGSLHGLLDWIAARRNDGLEGLAPLAGNIAEARRRLAPALAHGDGLRELLYLDLALEQLLRAAVERNLTRSVNGNALVDLISRVLDNLTLSDDDPELAACLRHWERLQAAPRFGHEWSLHAKAAADRIARGLSAWIDRFYQLLQPKAEYLGRGFGAEHWSIALFSEEVVRGSSLGFVLSMLLHYLDPLLRQAASIGAWHIISRGRAAGKVQLAVSLAALQRTHFTRPVVIIADQVRGDEEIPEGVAAVIAPDVTDVVSHVAVRARNAGILFAACHDPEELARLKTFDGREVRVEVNAGGDVVLREGGEGTVTVASTPRAERPAPARRRFSRYAVSLDEFTAETVGGKSRHQAELRGRLPDWVRLPASVAVPFGVFEQVLSLNQNRAIAEAYHALAKTAAAGESDTLKRLREQVLALESPPELPAALQAAMTRGGPPWPGDWSKAWQRIKEVWASKWNDRAVLSRRKMDFPDDRLYMAVLIQEVAPADYAFVIHTVNPANGNPGQLFAEVVPGLGETLVGNYPGRALGFTVDKATGRQTLLSFPGKSIALYGGGLIFRSDSNGEDLAGYAGAGLYDSVLLDEPRHAIVDYSQEPLVWDGAFRAKLAENIGRLGREIEQLLGAPQDIEGVLARGNYYVVQTRPQVGLNPGA